MSFVPESLEARLIPESAYVGETVVYRIELHRPEDVSVKVPGDLDMAPFLLAGVSQRAEKLGSGLVQEILELELGVYTLDSAELPSFELVAVTPDGTSSISVPGQTLEVLSIVEEEGETPREMEPPDSIWMRDYAILQAVGVALAVLVVLLALWKIYSRLRDRPRKATLAPPPPPRPAHEVALEALEELRSRDLVAKGERKVFFFRLSEIVRDYVGERFGFDSLELTTTELLSKLRDRPTPGLDLDRFRAWCAQCDMVKFARYEPGDAECNSALTKAFGFVEDTRPRLEADTVTMAGQDRQAAASGKAS